MSAPYPTYQEEQQAMYKEEEHDGSDKVCPTCKEWITEENYGGEGADGECDLCFTHRFEIEHLESEVWALADKLSDAINDYKRSRVKQRETLQQRITVETLSEALSMIKGALG